MNAADDPLLTRLAGLAADEHGTGEEARLLAGLAAGTLTQAEREALEAAAARSPALQQAMDAHRPLSADARARIVDAVARRVEERSKTGGARAGDGVVSIDRARARLAGRRRFLFAAAVPAMAAAAGVTLILSRRRNGGGEVVALLPGYQLELSGAESRERGSVEPAPATAVLRPDRPFALVARPADRVDGDVEVRAFVESSGGLSELTTLDVERLPNGVVRASGTPRTVFGDRAGQARLHLIVGRASVVAATAQDLARGAADRGPGWQRLTVEIDLAPAR